MENSIKNLSEIAGLYDEFILADEPAQIHPKESKKIANSTNNESALAHEVLMIYDSDKELMTSELEMLENLVKNALKLDRSKVLFVNYHLESSRDIDEFIESSKAQKVICWGVRGTEPDYAILKFGETTVICVESISTYVDDVNQKRKLWEKIRPVFELK